MEMILSGCDSELWLLSLVFIFFVFVFDVLFLSAVTDRRVVLICRPHAVMLSWHNGFYTLLLCCEPAMAGSVQKHCQASVQLDGYS